MPEHSPLEPTLQCGNCLERINAALTNCPYCGAVVEPYADAQPEPTAAQAAADARILKLLARVELVFFVLSFFPLTHLAFFGFAILLFGVPVLWLRWWIKYRRLRSAGSEYELAKGNAIAAALLWSSVIIVWLAAGTIQSWLLG
ncbi:MAG TPA: hypothetical protein PLD20_25265 [Blastocatellia bacterium]|nr:hypothetical protein [Blastocatellia bacterium]HMX24132.1 hypothetical protein [Blastocatellia bacterium]HMY70518.1 hypothetical protein [Blastocatellia bacterium]HMZ21268.1 hypothetical protein [Blastocatellia bacterium]HNG30767.1 hypothetical protein [Blastocatellia bacterium]